jgi:hypothetical protein
MFLDLMRVCANPALIPDHDLIPVTLSYFREYSLNHPLKVAFAFGVPSDHGHVASEDLTPSCSSIPGIIRDQLPTGTAEIGVAPHIVEDGLEPYERHMTAWRARPRCSQGTSELPRPRYRAAHSCIAVYISDALPSSEHDHFEPPKAPTVLCARSPSGLQFGFQPNSEVEVQHR